MTSSHPMMMALVLVVGSVLLLKILVGLVGRVFKALGIGPGDQAATKASEEEIETKAPAQAIVIRPQYLLIWIALTSGLFGVMIKAPTMAARAKAFLACFLILVVLAAVLYGILVLYAFLTYYLRHHDRLLARVLKRADRGDVEGAIAELKQIIEEHGPTGMRANTLGHFFVHQAKWQEAHKHYVEAERLEGRQAIFLSNQGYSLAKMGLVPEAIAVMKEACALEPENPTVISAYCATLADLGRFEMAAEQLRNLEPLSVHYARAQKPAFDAVVAQLRQRIAAGLGVADSIHSGSAADQTPRSAGISHP